jgi:CHAD domain-containing protein
VVTKVARTLAGVRFDLPPSRAAGRILSVLKRAGYEATPPARSRFDELFFDTQDGRLGRAGYRLALREEGGALRWRMAGTDGQWVGPFEGDPRARTQPPDPPGIPPRAAELSGERRLIGMVCRRCSCTRATLTSPDGAQIELQIESFTPSPPAGREASMAPRQRLLAVSLAEGGESALLHLATYLRDRLGLSPERRDAYQLALAVLDLPEPGAPPPEALAIRGGDTMAAAARKIVALQTLKMKQNSPGTVEDLDPEYLHDLRVASRRLRSALRLLLDVIGPRRAESLRVELRWIGGLLGAVRDLDVFIANLRVQAGRLGDAGRVVETLAEELSRRRVPAREDLLRGLDSKRYADLLRRLEALGGSAPPIRPRGAQACLVAEAAPMLIRRAQKRVLKAGRAVNPETPPPSLHRLRILMKRLRYTCEFFREAFPGPDPDQPPPLAGYIKALVRFQDCLGEHQDAMVAMARIDSLARELVAGGSLPVEALLDLGAFIQVQREIARERRGKLAKLWSEFDRPGVRRLLPGEASKEMTPSGRSETSPNGVS